MDKLKTQLRVSHEDLEDFKRQFSPSRLDEIEQLAREEERERRRRILNDVERKWKDEIEDYKAQLKKRDTVEQELRREIITHKAQLRQYKHESSQPSPAEEGEEQCAGCEKFWDVKEMFLCVAAGCEIGRAHV